ncbi:FecR family protein [Flexithrix dorotheae]|uniref:FecR family protein n=1 Tax=Flexithrix dorotheae TaxID=70993 RepID=UPI0003690E7D|nr:FecR family protein [Flexithrix dorotheae]
MEKWDLIAKYIAGEASEDEITQIENWEKESSANSQVLKKIKKVWENSENDPRSFNPDVNQALEQVNQKINFKEPKVVPFVPEKRISFYSNVRNIAAVILLLIGATFAYYSYIEDSNIFPQELSIQQTNHKERKTITLADGSKVWLNNQSTLKFPQKFSGNSREIHLLGEGYFEITKNPEKPFIIHLENQTKIEVLGTSFNVNANSPSEKIVVSVTSGKVKFGKKLDKEKFVILEKETQGIYKAKNQTFSLENELDTNVFAWRTGKLSFQNTPLNQVFLTLSKHYNKKFILENAALKDCQYNSSFDNLKLKEVANIIKKSYGFDLAIEENKIIFKGGKCL